MLNFLKNPIKYGIKKHTRRDKLINAKEKRQNLKAASNSTVTSKNNEKIRP